MDTMIVQKNIKDVEAYAGPHAIPGIRFRAARTAMGVSAWGMSVIEIDAHTSGYPEHDHNNDKQEELYLVLEGAAVLVAEDCERVVSRGDMVRVPFHVKRKFITRDVGVTLLALGATPGEVYRVRA